MLKINSNFAYKVTLYAQSFSQKKISPRIHQGQNWVFDNEIGDVVKTQEELTDEVAVYSHTGSFVGKGWMWEKAKICIRILTRNPNQSLDTQWLQDQIQTAIEKRNQQLPKEKIRRLFFGETDGISGLNIDQWNDYILVQCNTQALDKRYFQLLEVLQNIGFPPEKILKDDSSSIRQYEQLSTQNWCSFPSFNYQENQAQFHIYNNQQFSIDRRNLRQYLFIHSSGKVVWDLFCGNGNLGICCLYHQAKSVVFVDNKAAIADNFSSLPFKNFQFLTENVFDFLKKKQAQQADLILLDTPALGGKGNGLSAYNTLGIAALKQLRKGGILCWGTSSSKLSSTAKMDMIRTWILDLKVDLSIENEMGAGSDFPIHPLYEHTNYLHYFVIRKNKNWE